MQLGCVCTVVNFWFVIGDERAADVTIEMAIETDSEKSDGDDDEHNADEEDTPSTNSDEEDMAIELHSSLSAKSILIT